MKQAARGSHRKWVHASGATEPMPAPQRRYSGNLRLRLPASLRGRLAREAERERVSLNQWIVSKLAS